MRKIFFWLLLVQCFNIDVVCALTESEMIDRAGVFIRDLCKKDKFSGAVLIAHKEEVLFSYACGEASKSFHIPNKVNTKFSLGSINKMFTSVAIAQLEEQDSITYDDKISKYVDETWMPKRIADTITIRHLLTHTSGLGNYMSDERWKASRESLRSIEAYKSLIQRDVPQFEPGSQFHYSNTGMLLLGAVIEKVSGQDYFDYISENIYRVANMANSGSYEADASVENLAVGYMPATNGDLVWKSNILKLPARGGPAGGGYSTVGDMHRFGLALLVNKLISPDTRKKFWSPYLVPYYGYGFMLGETPAGKTVGHGGNFSGVSCLLDIYPDTGYIVVVLSNYSKAKARPVGAEINKLFSKFLE